jgi:lipopolysaccharide transport system permease protein
MFIQLILFALVYIYYYTNGALTQPNIFAFLFPVLILILAGLGLGFGIIISSLTTKYRDLKFLITFAIQLWMYATPVIYPLSAMKGKYDHYIWIIKANPVTAVMETFKYGFLGQGIFTWGALCYSFSFMIVVLLLGIVIFNKVERSFMDVI